MYSYEERLRAVKLYLTLGKRCKATIHQLGYPTKNTLKAWHDEFERRGDLQAGYARSKPKYSDELRAWGEQLLPDSFYKLVIRHPQVPRAIFNGEVFR